MTELTAHTPNNGRGHGHCNNGSSDDSLGDARPVVRVETSIARSTEVDAAAGWPLRASSAATWALGVERALAGVATATAVAAAAAEEEEEGGEEQQGSDRRDGGGWERARGLV